jgi:type II secretory pathway pseudopilin PulG
MMSLRKGHHNICCLSQQRLAPAFQDENAANQPSEDGYALVAMLALMTLLALFALAAAPSIQQQAQREREKEAIFRGEQVAEAIRSYYIYRIGSSGGVGDQSLPTSIDQLLEGIPVQGGSKKRQILRVDAARDPLSTSGEWGFVRPRSSRLIDFQRSVILYAGGVPPATRDPQMAQLQQFAAPQITSVLDIGSSPPAASEEESSDNSSGPFVGVASRNRNNSVLFYYGIDRHDHWIFTPLFK